MALDDQPDWAAKLIEDMERDPASQITEGDLRHRGVDPATVRRHFLRRYGMTFQAYTRSRRLSRAFNCIRSGMTLDNVILIPCHRIVNKNGDLGGYGGGLRRKQYLLNLEQAAMTEPA